MKNYQVFYWIKKNRHEYLEHMFVSADSAKDACRICKEGQGADRLQCIPAYDESPGLEPVRGASALCG